MGRAKQLDFISYPFSLDMLAFRCRGFYTKASVAQVVSARASPVTYPALRCPVAEFGASRAAEWQILAKRGDLDPM